MSRRRTPAIGLDGATFDLIRPLIRSGYLTTLTRIVAEGVCCHMSAWPNMNSTAACSSIFAGHNHGRQVGIANVPSCWLASNRMSTLFGA